MVTLRPYQEQALAARAAAPPEENRQAIVMATGLGKTITFGAEAAAEPGRSLILTHTDELAAQAEAKVKLMAPGRDVGVVKAERDDVGAEIIIGSVQTLANPARVGRLGAVDRIIVDECHHAVSPTYQTILAGFGAFPDCEHPSPEYGNCHDCYNTGWTAPPLPVTGYTATLERGDGQSLGSVWHDVAFSRDISWAVRKGFLVPPVGYRVEVPELAYAASDAAMDTALVDSIAPEKVVDAWLEHGRGRSTVLFAPLVKSARAFCYAFQDRGITAKVIHGDMPKDRRRLLLKAYDRGEIQVLCNAMVLTEGWDSPRTKCVIVARPTKSRPLFIQMAGRGLRRWPEGDVDDCVLLVVADSTTELRSIADLSDRPIEPEDGKSLLALEDEYDLSRDLEPDPEHAYTGAVDVRQFDPLVLQSSKVWTKTVGGTLFVPAGPGAYVFLAPDSPGLSVAYVNSRGGKRVHRMVPDTELAMAMAEDFAVEHGGDMGRLLADKDRAWRKAVPSQDMQDLARAMGLEKDLRAIMASKSAGKAGRLSERIDRAKASRMIDPVVTKIKARMGR